MAIYNYRMTNGTSAKDLIARLDPAKPVQAAHICEVWTLCKRGCDYTNQDLDVLSAAWAALQNGRDEPRDFEAAWVARWLNCPGYLADARRWAGPAQEQLPTELTPAGEQFVIPGCERNASPKAKQLGLFG